MSEATVDASWMQGYSLEELRQLTEPFRRQHKPLVFGAFGLTKERDVADALAAKALLYRRRADGSVSAAAIAKRLTRESLHRDFAEREVPLLAGSIYVRAFACIEASEGQAILAKLLEGSAPVVVEAFEEDAPARAALDACGFHYIATKITAGSEVKGLYSSRRPGHARLPLAELVTLEILRPAFLDESEHAAILGELTEYERTGPWAQHYSSYNKRKSWTAFALRGYDATDESFIIAPREMSEAWKKANPDRLTSVAAMTPAAAHFSKTLDVLDRLPGGKDRVRFMRLSPNGELTRHADITDRQAGVADGKVARLHIPLRTNAGVHFVAWDARGEKLERFLPERSLCYLDQRKPHAVRNASPGLERLHLVVDVISSPELREMIEQRELPL